AGSGGLARAAADRHDDYSGPLLWVLPLVGAAAAAAPLAFVLRPWRRRSGQPGQPGRPVPADPAGGGD
ncbi:hypothetical protein ND748_23460, partial [Frankia sp. AiPs1]|nr:hypothetical protein [Frankia sp. AiPs1]